MRQTSKGYTSCPRRGQQDNRTRTDFPLSRILLILKLGWYKPGNHRSRDEIFCNVVKLSFSVLHPIFGYFSTHDAEQALFFSVKYTRSRIPGLGDIADDCIKFSRGYGKSLWG